MKREEWYNSPLFKKLRLLNNVVHEIKHKAQHVGDILDMLASEHPELTCHDRYYLLERQLRVVNLEASNLISVASRFDSLLYPKSFDDDAYVPPQTTKGGVP